MPSGCAVELEGSIHFEEMRRAAYPDCMSCSIEDVETNGFAYARWRGYAHGQCDSGSLTSCGEVMNPRYQRVTCCHVRTPSGCSFNLDENTSQEPCPGLQNAAGYPGGVNASGKAKVA